MAMTDSLATNIIHQLSTSVLQPNPFQPRSKIKPEDLAELVQSVKVHGILEPLVVAHTPAGYQIIAGERRWRAAQAAGLTEVPAVIKKTNPKGMLEMALIENVQRVNLNPMERAQSFRQLNRDFNLSVSEISERIGKSTSYVGNTLKLLELPDAIKDGVLSGTISEGHARAISGIEDTKTMLEVFKKILLEGASVRRAEELARLAKKQLNTEKKGPSAARTYQVTDPFVTNWQERLAAMLESDTQVKLSRSNNQTRIVITLKGNEMFTQRDLEKIIKVTTPGDAS